MSGQMFNPYLMSPGAMLDPVRGAGQTNNLPGGILKRFQSLDGDDILLMLIIYLVLRDGETENLWPLVGALIYCML